MSGRLFWQSAMAAIFAMAAFAVSAADYMGRDDFLRLAFEQTEPEMQTLWLTSETRSEAKDAVGLAPTGLRMRYWAEGERTAWILEEIGKDKPITIGVAINEQRIERVEVLAFRESRGYEIRYPFFTDQFAGMELGDDGRLSSHVDGITGATLSVRAVDRVARLALWLDAKVKS